MPHDAHMRYTVNKSDTNKINAIALYNKHAYITRIGNQITDETLYCSDLANIIKKYPGEKITFEAACIASYTMLNVFPEVEEKALVAEIGNTEIPAVTTDIVSYMQTVIKQNSNNQQMFYHPPAITSLSKNEALAILKGLLDLKVKISGAVHLRTNETIFFQVDDASFELKYGSKPSVAHNDFLSFDIDDGFCHWKRDGVIPSEMVDTFKAWKKNNYQGLLFDYLPKPENASKEEKSPHSQTRTLGNIGQFGHRDSSSSTTVRSNSDTVIVNMYFLNSNNRQRP